MKRARLVVGVLLSVAGLVLLSSIMVLHAPTNQGATSKQTPGLNSPNVQRFAGTISFQFGGSNVTELTVAAGSATQGTILMNITQAAPFLIYINDGGGRFNQTGPTLPPGISVSLNMYGKRYDVPTVYEVPFDNHTSLPLSTVPLVPTALGNTSVQYAISVASTVPAGVYNVDILFKSILKNDMVPSGARDQGIETMYGYGAYYTVILHVQ